MYGDSDNAFYYNFWSNANIFNANLIKIITYKPNFNTSE